MVPSLSSDGFLQITQQPDVHLVSFQKKYASLYIFHLAFSGIFTAMHLQLRIFQLGFFFRGGRGRVEGRVNTTMSSTVFAVELFEIASGSDSVSVTLQLLWVLTHMFVKSVLVGFDLWRRD